jgi:hypothetical protein
MKDKILKIIFVLSFIPYLVIIGTIAYGTIFGIYSVNGVEVKGLEKFLSNIGNAYWYSICIPIIPACLTYQMCYINRKKPKAMFLCSFIPCAFVLFMGVIDAIFGISIMSSANMSYGFEGFQLGVIIGFMIYCTIYPIIPVCMLFQLGCIIYQAVKNKKAKSEEKQGE